MSSDQDFQLASQYDYASTVVFFLVTACSITLLLLSNDNVKAIVQPLLIMLCILGVVLSTAVRFYQTGGNRSLRDSQLRDAFDIPLGEPARSGYYNNPATHSLRRLALTTLENTRFTIAILKITIVRNRLITLSYVLLFIVLLAIRQTDLSWLLFFCQTIFSATIVLKWLRFERFLYRTQQSRQQLSQHFIEVKQREDGKLSIPIVLSAFAEYECAKDESACPLDSNVYQKINAKESENWQHEMIELGILTPDNDNNL